VIRHGYRGWLRPAESAPPPHRRTRAGRESRDELRRTRIKQRGRLALKKGLEQQPRRGAVD
jgi:hypothetical protein